MFDVRGATPAVACAAKVHAASSITVKNGLIKRGAEALRDDLAKQVNTARDLAVARISKKLRID